MAEDTIVRNRRQVRPPSPRRSQEGPADPTKQLLLAMAIVPLVALAAGNMGDHRDGHGHTTIDGEAVYGGVTPLASNAVVIR